MVACINSAFFFLLNNKSLFIHPSVDGRLDCFHFFAVMNNANINICV